MNLEQFGEELKKARLEKEISLMDISSETRINQKFLEAIECGKFHVLPQTYVRAFLREYALMLNMDAGEILERYESARQEAPAKKPEEMTSRSVQQSNKNSPELKKERPFTPLQRNLAFGIILVAAILIIIVLANLNKGLEYSKPVSEVPFDNVVRESDAASIPQPTMDADTSPAPFTSIADSLRLEITTHDSVWISLLIDGKKGAEYLFGANRKRAWTAKERFVVTMGNAGGATFQLNGKEIGPLGKRGAIIRNTVITEATLKNQ